ncbi:MAG TPA: glycosyltransferase family A protein, partial [Phenylobacterium sp.]
MRSIFAQRGVDFARLELVVVDNDRAGSARDLVEDLARTAPLRVIYLHEPLPGVAFARNAAMAKARGSLVAFLDDDEEAWEDWLAALLDVQARHGADVVFGPVFGRAPAGRHQSYLEGFFSRTGPVRSGPIAHYYGCGNSLLRRAALDDPTAPFAEQRNRIGGEDNLLFEQMQAQGRRFAWAVDACVLEHPDPSRLTLAYAVRRAFAYGQGAPTHCAAATPPDLVGVVRWMGIGLGQAVVFGAVAAVLWVGGDARATTALDRAARGLGKVLWWGPFRPAFYGIE